MIDRMLPKYCEVFRVSHKKTFDGKVTNENGGTDFGHTKVHYSQAADHYYFGAGSRSARHKRRGMGYSQFRISKALGYTSMSRRGLLHGTSSRVRALATAACRARNRPPRSKIRRCLFLRRQEGEAEPLIKIDSRQHGNSKGWNSFRDRSRGRDNMCLLEGEISNSRRWIDAKKTQAGRFDWT